MSSTLVTTTQAFVANTTTERSQTAPAPEGSVSGAACGNTPPAPRRPRLIHRLGLTLAALFITLLAVVYATALLGLTGAAVWLVAYGESLGSLIPFAAAKTALQLLLLCGLLLGIFLLTKGLWRVEKRNELAVPVDPTEEPDLVGFVEHVADIVRAPAPGRIMLNCGPEISIRFESLKDFLRNRPVLHLGLSAVAVSNSGQLAAQLAGALSRFGHGSGPRRGAFIAATNRFLARSTAGDDAVDRWLTRHARSGVLAPLAHGFLELCRRARCESRWLQRQVMRISKGVLARRMAFSRECAAYVGGELAAARVPARRSALRSAAVRATAAARQSWTREGRLPENLPLQAAGFFRQTQAIDSIQERAELACGTPADILFVDFYRTARKLTLLCYRLQMRLPVAGDRLGSDSAGQRTAVDNFFLGCFAPLIPLDLGSANRMQPIDARGAIRTQAEKMPEIMRRYRETDHELLSALQAEALLQAEIPVDPRLFGVDASNPVSVHERCRYLEGRQEWLAERLASFHRLMAGRLREAVKREMGTGNPHPEDRRLLEVLIRTDRLLPAVSELRTHLLLLEVLLAEHMEHPRPTLDDRIHERSIDILRLLKVIRIALRNTPYPVGGTLRHGLYRHVMRRSPEEDLTPAERLELGQEVIERLLGVRRSALERLTVLAAKIESHE